MALIDTAYARALGNLPAQVGDSQLQPHVDAAIRRVSRRVDPLPTDTDDLELCREAAGCFALALAIPVLNTFYLSAAEDVPKQVGETHGYVFLSPDDIETTTAKWEARAEEALALLPASEDLDWFEAVQGLPGAGKTPQSPF